LYERFVTDLFQVGRLYHRAPMPPERVPTQITLHQKSRVLEIAFSDGRGFHLPYEYLRVYSPSAEVRGHGPGQEVLQVGKRDVEIRALEPVGSYAVQIGDVGGPWLQQWWDGAAVIGHATPVVVTAGGTAEVDAALTPA